MSTVDDKLNNLLETKRGIKQAIKDIGGEVLDTDTFRSYPDKIEKLIKDTIIPQSTVDDLTIRTININGEEV